MRPFSGKIGNYLKSMGGRFGKYGDVKRRKALRRGLIEKYRLEKADAASRRRRSGPLPRPQKQSETGTAKTYKTAVVIIPPENVWQPIQALRKQYDRHYRRWMPHITLLFPFRPVRAFDQVIPLLAGGCRRLSPFDIRLDRFSSFVHSRRSATLFLAPEPDGPLNKLHQILLEAVPDCDDAAGLPGGFTPHLSVGQTHPRDADGLRAEWQAAWRPLVFTVDCIHLIWRNDPPDDILRIGATLPLGERSHGSERHRAPETRPA